MSVRIPPQKDSIHQLTVQLASGYAITHIHIRGLACAYANH